MNKSEQYVSALCTKSFLSLWSYCNPLGKNSKELCDLLVVCEPDVIIFSVKEIDIRRSGDEQVDRIRWIKRAIKKSYNQIYGAERWIQNSTSVITKEGKKGLPFPEISSRRIHRVAIALGSESKFPVLSADFGKGFVHVLDEISLSIIMNELDTISDFAKYLTDKESLNCNVAINGGEEDLLAFYLHNGRDFHSYDQITVADNLWEEFIKRREYQAKKEADKESYVWDRLIEVFCNDYL